MLRMAIDIVRPCSLRMKQNLITHDGTMSYNINKPSSCKQNIASHSDEASMIKLRTF